MLRAWVVVLLGCGRVGFDTTDGNTYDSPVTLRGCARTFTGYGDQICVARTDGQVWCWGAGDVGQLGDGTIMTSRALPGPAAIDDVIQIGAGEDTVCAVKRDGSLWCWGDGNLGQLGNGALAASAVPVPVALPERVVALGGASSHTCALLADGRGRCWGSNSYFEVSLFGALVQGVPAEAPIVGNLAFSLGDHETCAIRPDRTVACWGLNDRGGLGDGTTTSRAFGAPVAAITDPVIQIAGGCHKHWCAVTDRHEVWCWGDNLEGQVGTGAVSPYEAIPVRVKGVSAVQVAVGSTHTCVRSANDEVSCWGKNINGQTGAPPVANQVTPMRVEGVDGRLVDLQASCGATFALRADATLLAWGSSIDLGTGETADRYTPAEVALPCP